MADHLRTQIRDATVTALTGLTTTKANVFASRIRPLQESELPALKVMTEGETIIAETISAPVVFNRSLTLRIEITAKATSGLDDTLDQIAKEVEYALTWPALMSVAKSSLPVAISEVELDGEGDQPVGRISMQYEVQYFAAEGSPDVGL